jgi:hypothetical protein
LIRLSLRATLLRGILLRPMPNANGPNPANPNLPTGLIFNGIAKQQVGLVLRIQVMRRDGCQ